ncbi:hypothetical protein JMJ55_26210 [Belnapia sp. T6]|uniref:Lipoprotein n=1 Tax=Belnapia mucosa TaxID=2804532 RepID=A0ABS1VAX6_9PROT|nr:hypothetical protein [Belnapia mucosa]MBL6458830.1 hypothetical protein [Belnapia mucosa]
MVRYPPLLLMGLLLTACAAPATDLINDQGRRVRCSAAGFGVIGSAVALAAYQNCLSANQAAGYRIPGSAGAARPAAAPATGAIRPEATAAGAAAAPSYATGRDGQLRLLLPAGWQAAPPPPVLAAAQIYAVNRELDAAAAISADNRRDVADLTAYAEAFRRRLAAGLETTQVTELQEAVVAGRPALRFEVAGTGNGARLRFLFTVMAGSTQVVRINAWTTESRFAALRPQLEQLAEGLSEVPAPVVSGERGPPR